MWEFRLSLLDVDWADLELAFRDATGTENYLDLNTGEVVSVVPGFSDEAELREEIGREPARYLDLHPVDTAFAREAMTAFVKQLPRAELRTKLEVALHHKTGGLTRAMEHLRADAAQLAAWHRWEQARFWRHVDEVLRGAGVKPQSPPPAVELFEGASESSG
jgi:hypothetical protein